MIGRSGSVLKTLIRTLLFLPIHIWTILGHLCLSFGFKKYADWFTQLKYFPFFIKQGNIETEQGNIETEQGNI